MPNYYQDCIYNDMPSVFLGCPKIHVLGSFMKNGVKADINSYNSIAYAEIHEIYESVVFNVDALTDHNDSWWEDVYPTMLYKDGWAMTNSSYDTFATYTAGNQTIDNVRDALKGNVQINDKFYVLRASCTNNTSVNSPFSIGALKHKNVQTSTYQYEPVLICQGSEKSYYTLETRLYTWLGGEYTGGHDAFVDEDGTDPSIFSKLQNFLSSCTTGTPSNISYGSLLLAEQYYLDDSSTTISSAGTTFDLFYNGTDYAENYQHALNGGPTLSFAGSYTSGGKTKIPISRYLKNTADNYYSHYDFWRYIGGLLSDSNMYESQLGIVNYSSGSTVYKGVVQVPINGKAQSSGNPWTSASVSDLPKTTQYVVPRYKAGISMTGTGYQNKEGFCTDRDVILVSDGELYGLNNNNIKEMEFELFYCVNVNDPTATMNLVNFATQLNYLTANFNTKIPKSEQIDAFMSSSTTNKVYPQINARYSTVQYGSKVTFTQINNDYKGEGILNMRNYENSDVQTVPYVTFYGIYVWLQGKSPVMKNKYTLIGNKVAGTNRYTYGEYFIGLYDRALFLIDKITYDAYMYNPEKFTNEVVELLSKTDMENIGPFNSTNNFFGYIDTYQAQQL